MNVRVYDKRLFLKEVKDLNSKIKREIRIKKIRKILKINKKEREF